MAGMAERELKVSRWKTGDRVLLKPDESWLLPTRKFAKERRPATVVGATPRVKFGEAMVRIQFDTKRANATPHAIWAYDSDLSPA